MQEPFIPYGKNTFHSKEQIWESIDQARKRGYTYSESELENGTAAFGTPVFNRYGGIEGALSVAGFASELTDHDAERYIVPMWEACEKISRQLGFFQLYPYTKLHEE